MFFIASKIFWLLVSPLNFIALMLAFGLLIRLKWKSLGQRLIALGVAIFLFLGLMPVGDNLLTYLEKQYPRPQTLPEDITGIVMLGGTVSNNLSERHGYLVVNGLAERIHDMMILARKYPNAKIVFTGGSGDPSNQELREATYIRQLWNDMGLPNERLITEDESQNTYQNALYTKELLKPSKDENWLLITSAYHMPRSMAVFQQVEWDMIAYPTDHRTYGEYIFWPRDLAVSGRFGALQTAVKEYIGTAAYYITGKSSILFPHKI